MSFAFRSTRLAMAFGVAALLGTTLAAQAPSPAFNPAKTPDGQPDISGMWLPDPANRPMEVPAGKAWTPPAGHDPGTNAAFTFEKPDPARRAAMRDRRPMIVEPADGKIPLLPEAAAKREEIMAKQDKIAELDPRVRCLQSALPRANLPVGYNSYQIMQIPGYVVIMYEWNHMTRFIPLDGRPHLDKKVHLPMGDSRGRWEGNTLVVDVTNFTDRTWPVGHGAPPEGAPASAIATGHGVYNTDGLHVVERFTMIDANTIRYDATIEDPKVYSRPWTISFNAFHRGPSNHQLFEYACHEGNARNVKMMTGVDIEK